MWQWVSNTQYNSPLWTVELSLASLLSPVNHGGDCVCTSRCSVTVSPAWNANWVDVIESAHFDDITLLAIGKTGSLGGGILCGWPVIVLSILSSILLWDPSWALEDCWRRSSLACKIIYNESKIVKTRGWQQLQEVQLLHTNDVI